MLAVLTFSETDFLITASIDGIVKFWVKAEKGIEFVKAFKSHAGPVGRLATTKDGLYLATIAVPSAKDGTLKLYDVVNFDMYQSVPVSFTPLALAWCSFKAFLSANIILSSAENTNVFVIDSKSGSLLHTICLGSLHCSPIELLEFNPKFDAMLSSDIKHGVSFWGIDLNYNPAISANSLFATKSQTDFGVFDKKQSHILSITFSPDYGRFVIMDSKRQIRIFCSKSCRITHQFDESLESASRLRDLAFKRKDNPNPQILPYLVEQSDFDKRLCLEKDIDGQVGLALAIQDHSTLNSLRRNCVFNATGTLLLFPTLFGIKVVHLESSSLLSVIGMEDAGACRYSCVALFQGTCSKYSNTNSIKKALPSTDMLASDNPVLKDMFLPPDPVLFATMYRKSRFVLLSTRPPVKL